MNSPCKNSDTLSSIEDVSAAIDNLSLLTISSSEPTSPWKNSETQLVDQFPLPQTDINCNEVHANNCSSITTNETKIQKDVHGGNPDHAMTIPEDFHPTKDGGQSVFPTSVVPLDMQVALRDSIIDKVKMDFVIRQNDNSNPQRMLYSNSSDCVITLYDSESEESDSSLYSEDDSTDENSDSEFLSTFCVQKVSSSDKESLRSDGESVESSDDFSDSDDDSTEDSSDSDEDSRDSDDEPCDYDEQPTDDESEDSSDEDSDKPEPSSDGDSGDDDTSSIHDDESSEDEECSDHEDEECSNDDSSDDDKSIDLGDSSDSPSDASDSE